MRPARPLVVAVAFVMAVLAGTEGVASAQTFTAPRAASVKAPEQRWGSADGRPSTATAGDTSAEAAGGRPGHTAAPGELPQESGTSSPVGAASAPLPDAETAPVTVEAAEPKGFDAATSREVAAERQRTSRTFQNTDGTLTTRFYDEPVNFQDASGNWKPIDTTLKELPANGGLSTQTVSASADGWKITAGDTETTFAGYADGVPLVSLKTGTDTAVGFSIQDAAHTPGEADESTVVYPGVRPFADARFVAGGTSVKEVITLNSANAPTEWVFPLHTQGVTARLEPTGAVTFRDAAGGVRATMPAGWMEDANLAPDSNQGEISTGVSYELLDTANGQALKVSLDTEWLNAPQRVFPVKVDPTVTTVTSVNASSGTYVQSPYNADFSGDTNVKVGTYDAGGHKAAAFLRFAGVENTLKNAWVVGARLALYNTWSYSCTARPVTVHAITSNWAESTTRTYPGPSTGSALSSKSFTHGWRPEGQTAYPCGAAAWESIPLGSAGRQLVDDWTHGRKKNYGLAVKASTTDSKAWKNFGSDDYPNGKPSLDITWTKYGATYKLGEFVTPMTATSEGVFKVTVTNRGQQTWPKGGNFTLRYLLYDAAGKEITDTAKIRWTTMPADVPPGRHGHRRREDRTAHPGRLHPRLDDERQRHRHLQRRRSPGLRDARVRRQRPALPDRRGPGVRRRRQHPDPDPVGLRRRPRPLPQGPPVPVRGLRGRRQEHPQELQDGTARRLPAVGGHQRLAVLVEDVRLVRVRLRRQLHLRTPRPVPADDPGTAARDHQPPRRIRQRTQLR
nr:DNRLRE domain-containing protein [Streptomyces acidiscabies]